MPLRLFHQQKHHKVQTREVNWIYRRNTQKIALHKRLSMLYTGKNLWILTRKQILNYLRNLIKFVSRIISFGETIHKYMRHVKLHSMSKYFFFAGQRYSSFSTSYSNPHNYIKESPEVLLYNFIRYYSLFLSSLKG